MQLRYEAVEQRGGADEASALTLRTRPGWETAPWRGLTGLIEFEDVHAAGDYNDAVSPGEPFPVIADPEVMELNRAQVTWGSAAGFSATLGRQRIVLDDQRSVGAVGWRRTSRPSTPPGSMGRSRACSTMLRPSCRATGRVERPLTADLART